MPDHFHLVWLGLRGASDQWLATAFLRKHLAPSFGSKRLQDRAHDHVLRKSERERGALEAACSYVFCNPERAELVPTWREWRFAGCAVPGFPNLEIRNADYWSQFWKIYNRLLAPDEAVPALTRRATLKAPAAEVRGPLREEREVSA